jgi:hypothetical protein
VIARKKVKVGGVGAGGEGVGGVGGEEVSIE